MLHLNTTRAVNDHRTKNLILGLVFGAMTLASAGVLAATFTVNATRDTHDASLGDGACRDTSTPPKCSLRAAIEEANAHPGRDSVKLSEKTYALSLGTLLVTDDVDILGVSRTSTRIDGKALFRVFTIDGQAGNFPFTYFADLTIQNGNDKDASSGGGAVLVHGQFVGDRVVITRNKSFRGGGVAVGGQFICFDCTISYNTTQTVFIGPRKNGGGGLFIFDGGGAWLYRTTISNNTAFRGGGIAGGGYFEMREGTISGNTATAGGGGIKTQSPTANWWIGWSTITNNTANIMDTVEPNLGGGVFHTHGSLQIGKTIIAGNRDGRAPSHPNFTPDCATTSTEKTSAQTETVFELNTALISHWDNIYGNIGKICTGVSVTDGGPTGPYDQWNKTGPDALDVKLGPLQNNGGDVSTHQLLPGSIAIDDAYSGNPTGFWLFDCNGYLDATQTTRPRGAYCDDGSYEAR